MGMGIMDFEPKLKIALPVETDVKTFAYWLLDYLEQIPFNFGPEDGPVEGFNIEVYNQHLPGGHSGVQLFHLVMEVKNLRQSGIMNMVDGRWIMEIDEHTQGIVHVGDVRVERVSNNSIHVFIWSTSSGELVKNVFNRIFNAICEDFILHQRPKNMIDEKLQPGKPEIAPPGSESITPQQPRSETEVDIILSDKRLMKSFYRDYSPLTAKTIYKNIPFAWNKCGSEFGRWGPSYLAEYCRLREETITRYLRAFYCAGLRDFYFEHEWIPIPYHPRKPCPEHPP